MSVRFIVPLIAWALMAGCQAAAPPAGRAALQLYVYAEPKSGIIPAAGHVSVYDSAAAGGYATAYANGEQYKKVDYSALSDIVVWLEPLDNPVGASAASPSAVIEVDPGKPAHGVTAAVGVGQQIVFRNRGGSPADIYSVSDGNQFDLGNLAPGASANYTVEQSGLIEVLTSAVDDPIAIVYAAPSPWFALTQAGRTVDFGDLPPGQYRIVSWHPRLPGQQTTVNLSPGQTIAASIKVSVNSLPTVAQP
jgi:hypothetical protein